MTTAYSVSVIVLWIAIVVMAAQSVWLRSWKYLLAMQFTLIIAGLIAVFNAKSITSAILIFVIHIGLLYVFYYKYVMKDPFLKGVKPELLIAECRRGKYPFSWLFCYTPHAIFGIIVVLSFVVYIWPKIEI
jgi:hypothetical protein